MKMNFTDSTDKFLYDNRISRRSIGVNTYEYYKLLQFGEHYLGAVIKYDDKYSTKSHPFDFIYESEIDAIKALIAQKGR